MLLMPLAETDPSNRSYLDVGIVVVDHVRMSTIANKPNELIGRRPFSDPLRNKTTRIYVPISILEDNAGGQTTYRLVMLLLLALL